MKQIAGSFRTVKIYHFKNDSYLRKSKGSF